MIISGFVQPKWNIRDFYELPYKLKTPEAEDENISVYMASNCDPNGISKYLSGQLGIYNLHLYVNLLKPSQYLPMHTDDFQKYNERSYTQDDKKWYRFLIMLEDSQSGQRIESESNTWNYWKAGFFIRFEQEDHHAVYNFSSVDRYAVQVTAKYSHA